jgi:hypothetical protein
MASDRESQASDLISEFSSLFDRLLRHRDLSLASPLVFSINAAAGAGSGQNPDQLSSQATNPSGERIILINPFTQGMVVIEGTSSIDTLLQLANEKSGHPPASKASIEAMPSVEIDDHDDGDNDCVICLEGWDEERIAKEMPCKHKFHEGCIKKWLGIHGSCPVCRYNMPVEDSLNEKKIDDDGEDHERRDIWVSFSFNRRNHNQIASTELSPSEGLSSTELNDSTSSESEHHQELDG